MDGRREEEADDIDMDVGISFPHVTPNSTRKAMMMKVRRRRKKMKMFLS